MAGRLGVCSWSLRPESPEDLVEKMVATGLSAVQLALDPLRTGVWGTEQTVHALKEGGIEILSGMMEMAGEDYSTLESIKETGGLAPDGTWEENRSAAKANGALAEELGLSLVSFHAGFLPHDSEDPARERLLGRLAEVTEIFSARGVSVAFETGQETAETLAAILTELNQPTAGVNFDPANMILYGMGDPVESLQSLLPWVKQIHIKDAQRTTSPGCWGTEVPVGMGEVDWAAFLGLVRSEGLDVDLVLEREAGDQRQEDLRVGASLVLSLRAGGA